MSRFFTDKFASLTPYTPGEQPRDMEYIKLNTNESPYPPAPGVVAAIGREQLEQLRLYSDPTGKVLKERLAELFGLHPENIFLSLRARKTWRSVKQKQRLPLFTTTKRELLATT